MLNTTLKMQIPIMYNTTTSKAVCEALGALWEPVLSQHFDNVFAAMGSLFEMTTTEGWVDVMYAGIDATDIDMQPIRDHHVGWSVFFIFYMVVGSFFVMNLFVGIVIDNFNNMKNKVGGDSGLLMSASQMQWVKTQETLLKIRPQSKLKPPRGVSVNGHSTSCRRKSLTP